MSGETSPLKCCDRDCAEANGCRVGGYRCVDCGLWYCIDFIESVVTDGAICMDCAERRGAEVSE